MLQSLDVKECENMFWHECTTPRKYFTASWSHKASSKEKLFLKNFSRPHVSFLKNPIFCRFPYISQQVRVIWTWNKFFCKALMLRNVKTCFGMSARPLENILRPVEVTKHHRRKSFFEVLFSSPRIIFEKSNFSSISLHISTSSCHMNME